VSLIQEIQIALLDENARIEPILLKLRFLADRLGSDVLEEWVRHETNGYEQELVVPDYRTTSITYKGTFTNGYQTLNNVSVAPYLIKKHAGDQWVDYNIRDSLAVIETMISNSDDGNGFSIDTGNLKLLIADKIYDNGTTCIELVAHIDISAFVRIISAVRTKLLDFTLELEKRVPISSLIEVGKRSEISNSDTEKVTQITQNVFNAPVNNISNSGAAASISVTVQSGDVDSLKRALVERGLSSQAASELAEIAESEEPESPHEPFGTRAKSWISKRVEAGADGILKIGGQTAKDEISDLFQQFYDKFL